MVPQRVYFTGWEIEAESVRTRPDLSIIIFIGQQNQPQPVIVQNYIQRKRFGNVIQGLIVMWLIVMCFVRGD